MLRKQSMRLCGMVLWLLLNAGQRDFMTGLLVHLSDGQNGKTNGHCVQLCIQVGVHEKLHDLKPEGYEFFLSMLAYGKIICSSKFPSGYITILAKINGEPVYCYLNPPSEPFAEEKLELPIEEQLHIYAQCRKAICVLRSISLYLPNTGTQNVLYDKESNDLTVLDFEKPGTVDSEEELRRLDNIELELIFGRETAAELKGLCDERNSG